ncbi:MAG: electron transfer flavoprotein subunit beta/FixA family protein [Desulfobacterota bacterium]|nr:electron transfer flavoprotein subunit beta/FixA family protein [Thermodesulfobacteriota bacterium]
MKMIVCVKQVPDPQASSTGTKVDVAAKRVIVPHGTPPVMSPYDESALEAALKIKDVHGGHVTVMSVGKNLARPVLRKALASGADELILLEDNTFDQLDSYATASILAAAIREIGTFDLILCGRQAADTDAGQVGSGLAELLHIPCVTVACGIELGEEKVNVTRIVSDGYEVIEVMLPALVTVSSEIGELRYPKLKDLQAAQKMPIVVRNAGQLGIDVASLMKLNLVSLSPPQHRNVQCCMISAETPEIAGEHLALTMRGAGLI